MTYSLLDEAHMFENYERALSRKYGARPIDWDQERGIPTAEIGPQPDIPRWMFALFYYYPAEVKFRILCWWCDRVGHDIQCDAVYPEDGAEDLSCRRCGWSTTAWH